MALDLDEIFSTAMEGMPKVLDLMATVPVAKRAVAWSAAQQGYVQTALRLGHSDRDANQWASAVRCLLEIAFVARERAAKE
jgi:hypothetical protein